MRFVLLLVGAQPRLVEELPPLIFASALTAAITYPVDFLRAMSMASADSKRIVVQPLAYFTKGLAPELAKGTISRIIKFGGFPLVYSWMTPSTASRAAAGAIATVPEIAVITPLEVAKLALQLDAVGDKRLGNSLSTATRSLLRAGGPSALYAGHFGLQMRQAVWTSVYFATLPLFGENLAVAGLAAGVLGALINNPIDVCRSVAQKQVIGQWVFDQPPVAKSLPYVGATFRAGNSVLRKNGIRGLWAGSAFKACHLGFGGALMAALQPQCTKLWKRTLELRGGALLAGYNPFGLVVTDLGLQFLEFQGSRDSDLGRLLSTLKTRKRRSTIKQEWLEILRVAKTAQAARIYKELDNLLNFLLACGFLA